ncbi:MAG TPA: TadE family protein [Polyangia bacterium]
MRKIRQRRTRGVAMTEFLVGLPIMIVLWAGVDYFRMGYARRLDTMNLSHAAAWTKAYSNDGSCYGGASPWGGWTGSNSQMPDGNGDGQGLDRKFNSTMFMYNTARSTKSEATNSSRWSGTVKSSTTITCNEVVPTDDRNVLTPLVDFVKSFL